MRPIRITASPDGTYSWTGDTINSIVDNKNPGVTPGDYGSRSQSFTSWPTRLSRFGGRKRDACLVASTRSKETLAA